jgi:hypothetical protein
MKFILDTKVKCLVYLCPTEVITGLALVLGSSNIRKIIIVNERQAYCHIEV